MSTHRLLLQSWFDYRMTIDYVYFELIDEYIILKFKSDGSFVLSYRLVNTRISRLCVQAFSLSGTAHIVVQQSTYCQPTRKGAFLIFFKFYVDCSDWMMICLRESSALCFFGLGNGAAGLAMGWVIVSTFDFGFLRWLRFANANETLSMSIGLPPIFQWKLKFGNPLA